MDFAAIFSDYARVILEFLLEIYVFCVLVTLKLNRAKYFALRAAGIVVVAGVAFAAAIVVMYGILPFTAALRI